MELSASPFNPPKYDQQQRTMDIYSEDGAWYRFFDVPLNVWEDFEASTYKSLFFNDYIADAYKWKLIK